MISFLWIEIEILRKSQRKQKGIHKNQSMNNNMEHLVWVDNQGKDIYGL